MSGSGLVLEEVSAYYGRLQALFSVSFEVAEGEVVALLGSNGAGKSTTLRAISRLVRSEGRITLDGLDLTRCSPDGVARAGVAPHTRECLADLAGDGVARAGVAHVPEGRGTFSQLTTEENLLVAAASVHRTKRAARAAVEGVLPYVAQLADHLGRPAGLLSGGQQQLLAIGRGLLARPRVLMVDEPTLGLAPKLAQELVAKLRELQRELGFAVVLVEQNAALALGVADRTYVLVNGRIDTSADATDLSVEGLSRRYFGAEAAAGGAEAAAGGAGGAGGA